MPYWSQLRSARPEDDCGRASIAAGTLLRLLLVALCSLSVALPSLTLAPGPSLAQAADPAPAVDAAEAGETDDAAPEPYSQEELEVLVARIALYPDDLVAAIASASLYPLQIVEAARFLDAHEKDTKLEPKASWDGSVIALLNYPEIVRMMSEDLDWTQQLGEALVNQQKDVLIAIQQLRDEAMAAKVITSDDKVTVTKENDNVVIQSADPQSIYIPQYQPEMLYDAAYPLVPVTYAAEPYPSYFWPTATFFTGAITGAVWASAVDWNDWGVWGGRWRGNVDFDCNNCFNNRNFNGRLNVNDIDWKNVDRSKLHIDRDRLGSIDRNKIRQGLNADHRNDLRAKAADVKRNHPGGLGGGKVGDIRKHALQNRPGGGRPGNGLPGKGGGRGEALGNAVAKHPNVADRINKGGAAGQLHRPGGGALKPGAGGPKIPAKISRPGGAPKPGGRIDHRPKVPSGLGEIRQGRTAQIHSARGAVARGGGQRALPHRPAGGGKGHARAGRRH